MKIKGLEQLKNRLDISERTFVFLMFFSIAYLAGCFAFLVPLFRNLIIIFGEFLVHRPLNHSVWHARFTSWSLSGIVLYTILTILFIGFFLKNIFPKEYFWKKICLVIMVVFVLLGVFAIMFQANWIFSDDHEYITTTAINKYVPIYISGGRFFPLGHFHYNIPLFIFRLLGINSGLPVEAHFALIALFYSLSVICLFLLFNRIEPVKGHIHPVFSGFFACTFFLLGGTFCTIFMNLPYPETQGVMLFSVFMLMYYRALETDKKRYYIAALIAAVYNSYCKEPVFGAFVVIAISNFLFKHKNQTKRESIFYTAIIVNGILFITAYYFFPLETLPDFIMEAE